MSQNSGSLKQGGLAATMKLLAKDSFVFGGLGALTKFFALFLTPILTRFLTKEEYGVMDMLTPILSITGTIIVMGMDSAVARFYYHTDLEQERKEVISNGFWTQVITSVFVVILLYFLKGMILRFYLKESYHPTHDLYLNVIAAVILLSVPIRFAQNLLIWTYDRKKYVILSGGFIVVNFFSILCCVFSFDNKLLAVFFGQLLPNLLFSVLAVLFIKKHIIFNIHRKLLAKMLNYGMPLVVLAFIPALIPALDRSAINNNFGLTQVANYGIGYRIATLIALPISSINTALGPFILKLHKERNAERLFNIATYSIIVVISSLILLIVLLSPLIIRVLATEKYLPGVMVVAPLCFYFLVDGIRSICASGIDLSMKTYWNLILYPVGLIALFVLIKVMTPQFGIFGTALALFLTSVLNFILFSSVGSWLYPFKYNIGKKTLLIFFSFAIAYLISMLQTLTHYYLYGTLLLILFPIAGFFVFLTRDEREQMVKVFRQRILKHQSED